MRQSWWGLAVSIQYFCCVGFLSGHIFADACSLTIFLKLMCVGSFAAVIFYCVSLEEAGPQMCAGAKD